MLQLAPTKIRCLLAATAVAAVIGGQTRTALAHREAEITSTGQHVTRASWYGRAFRGRRTASGRVFNPNELTAAHRTLRLGTHVRVTDVQSGRSVVVQITDRGPYRRGRGIDLSYAAARNIGIVDRGVASVRLEPIDADESADDADPSTGSVARASETIPELRALPATFE